jgi:hypothetical protein
VVGVVHVHFDRDMCPLSRVESGQAFPSDGGHDLPGDVERVERQSMGSREEEDVAVVVPVVAPVLVPARGLDELIFRLRA